MADLDREGDVSVTIVDPTTQQGVRVTSDGKLKTDGVFSDEWENANVEVTYNADGTVATTVETIPGKTRTTTYTYTDGMVTGYTVVIT